MNWQTVKTYNGDKKRRKVTVKILEDVQLGIHKQLTHFLYVKFGKKEYYLGIVRDWMNGNACWQYRVKQKGGTYTLTQPINSFPYIWGRIKWNSALLWLRITRQTHKRCHGCGEGIQEWRIKNPNYEEEDVWRVCKHCLLFYDVNWSAKPITITTKNYYSP